MTIIPNTNTIKSMSIFNFLNQVDFNTDQNHHTENVVIIAKRFGSDQDIECAEYVLKRHEEEQCMTEDLRTLREYILDNIFSKKLCILQIFNFLNLIKSCLGVSENSSP